MAAGNTYVALATQTVASTTASVTFSSIPGTYTDLVIVFAGFFDVADTDLFIRFNGDTGTNYSDTFLEGNGTTATSARKTTASGIFLAANDVAIGGSSTNMSNQIMSINNYSNTTTYKTIIGRTNTATNSGVYFGTAAGVGLWRNTAAITSIVMSAGTVSNISAGSTFSLYGILAA